MAASHSGAVKAKHSTKKQMFPGPGLLGSNMSINTLSGFAATIRLKVTFEREKEGKQAYSPGTALKWALWAVCTCLLAARAWGQGGVFGEDKGRNKQSL